MNSQETIDDLQRRLDRAERALSKKVGVETALRASEERYRAFVTASSDVVYRMSPDWSEMRRLDGRMFLSDTDKPSGDWADTYILPEDHDIVFSAIQKAVQGKRMFELEHRVRRADGGIGWTLSRAVPILTEDGEITEWVGTASDVTGRRTAEEMLRRSEQQRHVALDGGRMGTWRWDLGARLVGGDARFLALWGFPPSDEPHPLSLFTDCMSPDGVAEMAAIVTTAVETGKEFDRSLEIVSGPAAGRWIQWRGRAAADDPSALSGVTFDITEQREADTGRRESEARFRQFAASSADGLWIRDAATLTMEYVSPAIQTIYGVPPETLLGDPARWTALIVPEDRETALRHLEQACRGETVVHEFRIRRPSDGALRWIRDTDFPLLDEHGRVQRIGGIAQDVTEAKAAAGYQKVLQHELQHRVRNILALLRSVATRTGETSDTVEQFASHLRGRLDALARTQAVLTRAPSAGVDLESMIREELLAQAAKEEQLSVAGPAVRLAPKTAEVLTLAVHELATNAVKYGALSAPAGHVNMRWSLSHRDGSEWLGLIWTETGVRVAAMAPRRVGFGTELIERRVPYELDGRGELEFRPGGVRCTIDLPLQSGGSILQTDAPGSDVPATI